MIQINTLAEFSDVKDYYYVQGDTIYSNWSGELKPLEQYDIRRGYHQVFLQTKNSKKQKGCLVHRIVCTAYHENPDPAKYTQVNHVNHDPSDNRPENLEWVTPGGNTSENNIWMEKQRKVLESTRKKVMLKDVENCKVIVFQSYKQCAQYLGVSRWVVRNAVKKGNYEGYIVKELKEGDKM
jgi:hypothetical protein